MSEVAPQLTVKLCDLDGLTDGNIAYAEVDGRPIAYAHIGENWFAVDDTCTHAKVSLSDGIVDEDDCTIECPKHGALFSLETGEALTLPAIRPVARHQVEIRESEVWVTINTEEDT
ncbi:MAG: non-heme iron oxygenase ferredoxin subunit [Acidimicrobiales bacterium]